MHYTYWCNLASSKIQMSTIWVKMRCSSKALSSPRVGTKYSTFLDNQLLPILHFMALHLFLRSILSAIHTWFCLLSLTLLWLRVVLESFRGETIFPTKLWMPCSLYFSVWPVSFRSSFCHWHDMGIALAEVSRIWKSMDSSVLWFYSGFWASLNRINKEL